MKFGLTMESGKIQKYNNMKKLLVFILLFPCFVYGAFTPTNPVQFRSLGVDTCHAITGVPSRDDFFNANLDEYVNGLCSYVPLCGDFFYALDLSCCTVTPRKVPFACMPGAGGNPDQNLWETIASDCGSVAANITTDTFTIAGSGSVSTAIVGDTLTIAVAGLSGCNAGDQDLWETIASDCGSVAANILTDTFTIAGGVGISTAIVGDILTITNDNAGSICGTSLTHAMFGPCGDTVIDSHIRQLCGDFLFDDGVNDIITIDFTTNPTGAITIDVADVSGTWAIDNGLGTNDIVKATGTDGELIPSSMTDSGTTVTFKDLCGNTDFEVSYGSGTVIVDATLRMKDQQSIQFRECSCNGNNYTSIKGPASVSSNETYILAEMNGSGVGAQIVPVSVQAVNLTADDTVIGVDTTLTIISSDNITASLRTFTFDLANMIPSQTYTFRWTDATDRGELLDAGVYFLSADWRPDGNDVLSGYTDNTNFYETARSTNR